MSAETVALVVVAGLATGVLSALFGVGGGLVMVPFMVLALSRSQHVAEGTSLLVIVPTAVVGVVSHLRRGYVSFRHAVQVATGGIAGAWAGAELALSFDAARLTRIFAVFLLVMGARTVFQGVRSMRRTPV
jgi:uncharacterized membrane protein YfcA